MAECKYCGKKGLFLPKCKVCGAYICVKCWVFAGMGLVEGKHGGKPVYVCKHGNCFETVCNELLKMSEEDFEFCRGWHMISDSAVKRCQEIKREIERDRTLKEQKAAYERDIAKAKKLISEDRFEEAVQIYERHNLCEEANRARLMSVRKYERALRYEEASKIYDKLNVR